MKDLKGVKDVKTNGVTPAWVVTVAGAGAVAGALLLMAACGGSAPPTGAPQAPAAQPASPIAAQTGTRGPQSLQPAPHDPATTPVDFASLVALMPELAGWTRNKPEGEQVTLGVAMSRAEAIYEQDESSIKLEITDTSFGQLMLAPLSFALTAGYSERTSGGYKKFALLAGSPGFESWEDEPRNGEVTVVVGNRFIASAKGRNVATITVLRGLVLAVDLKKLSALK